MPPPYWAFAWAGGQALARYVLDHPEIVAGKRVLDIGAGSGLVGLAAAKAGAAQVLAADIDAFSFAAIRLNAAANDVRLAVTQDDLIGTPGAWDVILVGDLFYERPLAERLLAWLAPLDALALLGDPGRTYFPNSGIEKLASYSVSRPRAIWKTARFAKPAFTASIPGTRRSVAALSQWPSICGDTHGGRHSRKSRPTKAT